MLGEVVVLAKLFIVWSVGLFFEFSLTIIPLALIIAGFKKARLSYLLFVAASLIVPTLTGTLLSMPRFALVSFLLFPFAIERLGGYFKLVVFIFIIL